MTDSLDTKFYRLAIKTIGLLGSKTKIINNLNEVASESIGKDEALHALCENIRDLFEHTSSHSSHTSIRDLSSCKEAVSKLTNLCEQKLR